MAKKYYSRSEKEKLAKKLGCGGSGLCYCLYSNGCDRAYC